MWLNLAYLPYGLPSESNTYSDIEAVYQCLETEYGVSQEDLILYGQSVGSGPTLHLASKLPRLRGVVLHSAILSGLRVLCHVKFTFCFDIYKNINKIKKVKCPVLVIHAPSQKNFLTYLIKFSTDMVFCAYVQAIIMKSDVHDYREFALS
uniref:Uncharacterized protein n=1 Tax=Quercus lobata TaxID=97700 RepID=A0A7N2MZQ4_QUELO